MRIPAFVLLVLAAAGCTVAVSSTNLTTTTRLPVADSATAAVHAQLDRMAQALDRGRPGLVPLRGAATAGGYRPNFPTDARLGTCIVYDYAIGCVRQVQDDAEAAEAVEWLRGVLRTLPPARWTEKWTIVESWSYTHPTNGVSFTVKDEVNRNSDRREIVLFGFLRLEDM